MTNGISPPTAALRKVRTAVMQSLCRRTAIDLGIVLTRPPIAKIRAGNVDESSELRTDEIRHNPAYNHQSENRDDALLIQPRAVEQPQDEEAKNRRHNRILLTHINHSCKNCSVDVQRINIISGQVVLPNVMRMLIRVPENAKTHP